MSMYVEGAIKIVFLITALIWTRRYFRKNRNIGHKRRLAELLISTALGILAWFNFFGFHTDGSFLHNWEQFHYFVGSKYYPELGHDGLYVAAIAARQSRDPSFSPPDRVRDLRSNRVVAYTQLLEQQQEVIKNFSESRWQAFVDDVANIRVPEDAYRDHGYNPPPTWTAAARLITAWLPVRRWSMAALALLDVFLLGLSLFALSRAFGIETAAFCALLFGGAFLSRFYWSGGAFLRFDWFAAIAIGLSMLEINRQGLAGALFAYAVAVRLFPVLLFLGLGAWLLRAHRTGHTPGWLRRFSLGFVIVTVMLLLGGTLAGRGISAYREAAENLAVHHDTPGPNGVGLRTLAITSLSNLKGDLVDPGSLYETNAVVDDYLRLLRDHRWEYLLAAILLVALVVYAAYHAPGPVEAIVIAMGAIFIMSTLSCYYWVLLCLMPLFQPRRAVLCGLAANLSMWVWSAIGIILVQIGVVKFNGALFFFPASLIVLITLPVWLFGIPESLSRRPGNCMKSASST